MSVIIERNSGQWIGETEPISGRIIDLNRNAVPDLQVLAMATPSYYHAAFTDADGVFEIQRACPDAAYDLSVTTRPTKPDVSDAISLKTLFGIRPPAEDITIMVRLP